MEQVVDAPDAEGAGPLDPILQAELQRRMGTKAGVAERKTPMIESVLDTVDSGACSGEEKTVPGVVSYTPADSSL
jgi:hypothetical protein